MFEQILFYQEMEEETKTKQKLWCHRKHCKILRQNYEISRDLQNDVSSKNNQQYATLIGRHLGSQRVWTQSERI